MSLRSLLARLAGTTPVPALPSGGADPVTAWLDAAGIPWRDTRGTLAARYGVHADNPYRWDIVPLDVQPPLLDGLLWPLGFQAFPRQSPLVAPERLSTHLWVRDDAEANIQAATAQLDRHLGPRPVIDRYNTRAADWQFGLASVHLLVWPAAMQTGARLPNAAHDRDPRLGTACSITVRTGWRPALSGRERRWVDGFVPVGPTRNWLPAQPQTRRTMYAETLLEFTRAPPDGLANEGRFGVSADRQALIVWDGALYVVPLTDIDRFDVTRTLPAKGGGGSRLSASCRTGYPACPAKDVPLAEGERADDLNDIAAVLAKATGKPLRLAEYDYDC